MDNDQLNTTSVYSLLASGILTQRACKALVDAGIDDLCELSDYTYQEIYNLSDVTDDTYDNIIEAMGACNIQSADPEEEFEEYEETEDDLEFDIEKDYYAILGVTRRAEIEVIKAAYKALSLKYHPDTSAMEFGAANQISIELNEAYAVLKDQEKRERYDQLRSELIENTQEQAEDNNAEPDYDYPQNTPDQQTNYEDRGEPDIDAQAELKEKLREKHKATISLKTRLRNFFKVDSVGDFFEFLSAISPVIILFGIVIWNLYFKGDNLSPEHIAQPQIQETIVVPTEHSRPTADKRLNYLIYMANRGDATAQLQLVMDIEAGLVSAEEAGSAQYWYRRATERKSGSFLNELGLKYDNGDGVKQNDALAVRLYRIAAFYGEATAQFNLGMMYEGGEGVARDIDLAISWYEKAIANGVTDAAERLREIRSSEFRSEQKIPKVTTQNQGEKEAKLTQSQELVNELLKKAQEGDGEAQLNLSHRYKRGEIVPKNNETAFYWLRRAANRQFPQALFELGLAYKNGWVVIENNEKAFALIRTAAEIGYQPAQFHLGLMYEKGEGVVKDVAKAISWFREVAKKGSHRGKRRLDNLVNSREVTDGAVFGKFLQQLRSLIANAPLHSFVQSDHVEALTLNKLKKLYLETLDTNFNMENVKNALPYLANTLARLYMEGTIHPLCRSVDFKIDHKCTNFDEFLSITPDYRAAFKLASLSEKIGGKTDVLGELFEYGYGREVNLLKAYDKYLKSGRRGDEYYEVNINKLAQRLLKGRGQSISIDGDFGPSSCRALLAEIGGHGACRRIPSRDQFLKLIE